MLFDISNLIRRIRSGYWRRRYGLAGVDPSFLLSWGCHIARDFEAGAHGYMGHGCVIRPRVRVGRYVMFGPEVFVVGADHRFDQPGTPMIFSGRPELEPTLIGDDVWIGGRATLLAGIEIGDGSIIAAGSIVTRDVAPYTIVAGVPARPLRRRFPRPEDEQRHAEMLREGTFLGQYAEKKR